MKGVKLKNSSHDSISKSKGETNKFFNIALQLTRRCNLSCLHCCEYSYVEELGTQKLFEIIENITKHGVERVCITGGEPTIRKDFLSIVDYLNLKDVSITLASNCYNLNEVILKNLKGKIDNIRTTVYGDETIHNLITKKQDSFKNLAYSIKAAKQFNIPVYACMSLMKKNLSEISTVADICKGWGIERLILFPLMPKGKGKDIFNKEKVCPRDILDQIKKYRKTTPKIYLADLTKEGTCVMIHPNGDLVGSPCYTKVDGVKVIGNVLKHDLNKLWKIYPFKNNYLKYYER